MSKIQTLLVAALLAMAPGLALAECGWGTHEMTMTCAQGTSWDADSQSCVPTATS